MQNKTNVIWMVVAFAVAGISYVYLTLVKPVIVTARAIGKTASHESAEISYSTSGEQVTALLTLAGKDKMSAFNLKVKETTEGEGDSLEVKGQVDTKNMYLQGNYAEPKLIDQMLTKLYAKMTTTKTYKTVSPVWKGEKWLHITIPENPDATNEEVGKLGTISSSNELRFAAKWLMAVKPRGITNNYEYEGQKYKKIAYGIRKNALISAVEDIKNYDVEVKVSQINSVVSAIESSDDWDRDLATFLIDKEGNMRVIMLELPMMDVEKVDRSISENAGSSGNALAGSLAVKLKNMVLGEEKETVELGTIKLDKFDQVEEATVPEPAKVVEAEVVMTLAQQELGPVLAEILTGKPVSPTTSTSTKTSTSTVKTVTKPSSPCYQYKIREGEFASDKCYSKSDYDDLVYYINRYNSAVFAYNGAASQANVTCGGFSDNFKQQCEINKQEMQKAEADKQLYAGNIRTVMARGK